MTSIDIHIAIVYNLEDTITRGEPYEIIALQETAHIAHSLNDALTCLGYKTSQVPVYASLDHLKVSLGNFNIADTFVFNLCDDFAGESLGSARVAKAIEELGFMYTGATPDVVALCINKAQAKEKLIASGVPTPNFQVLEGPNGDIGVKFPAIVKPLAEDASFGIDFESVVTDCEDLFNRVNYIVEKYNQPAIVEEFIPGRELTVGLVGNEVLEVLPISEVDYSAIDDPLKHILTYEAKWVVDSPLYQSTPVCCPINLSVETERRILQTAIEAYRAVGLRDYGRIDIRYHEYVPYVIEVNEIPDLSPDAGFTRAALVAGYTYPEMVDRIVKEALAREGYG